MVKRRIAALMPADENFMSASLVAAGEHPQWSAQKGYRGPNICEAKPVRRPYDLTLTHKS